MNRKDRRAIKKELNKLSSEERLNTLTQTFAEEFKVFLNELEIKDVGVVIMLWRDEKNPFDETGKTIQRRVTYGTNSSFEVAVQAAVQGVQGMAKIVEDDEKNGGHC